MCLVLVAVEQHPQYPLIVVANRDEFHARPTRAARFWPDQPDVLAGRDLAAGGTWLGVHRDGRFACVTNFRQGSQADAEGNTASRGELVSAYLAENTAPAAYGDQLAQAAPRYAGFNLIWGDGTQQYWGSNRTTDAEPRFQSKRLTAGVQGLSNHLLNTPWPKLTRSRAHLQQTLAADTLTPEALAACINDRAAASDELLPDTGIGIELERLLSPPFIVSPTYGTRCTTVLMYRRDGAIEFYEERFDAQGVSTGTSHHSIAPADR